MYVYSYISMGGSIAMGSIKRTKSSGGNCATELSSSS